MITWSLLFVLVVAFNCVAKSAHSAALFKSRYAMCHGPGGTASTPMAKKLNIKSYKSPDVQKQSDADHRNTIVNGKGKNTFEQVHGLVKNIRELGKE